MHPIQVATYHLFLDYAALTDNSTNYFYRKVSMEILLLSETIELVKVCGNFTRHPVLLIDIIYVVDMH